MDKTVARRVPFVLLAVDPLAMRVASERLSRLQEANIPVLIVEGNHACATYRDELNRAPSGARALAGEHHRSGRSRLHSGRTRAAGGAGPGLPATQIRPSRP